MIWSYLEENEGIFSFFAWKVLSLICVIYAAAGKTAKVQEMFTDVAIVGAFQNYLKKKTSETGLSKIDCTFRNDCKYVTIGTH